MNITLEVLLTLLAVLCVSLPVGILVVAAIFGIRSRIRYADRLRHALARCAFADMNLPENRARFRRLAVFALVGLLGMFLSMAVLVVQLQTKFASFYGITVTVAIFLVLLLQLQAP